jgi:hypothetical protein
MDIMTISSLAGLGAVPGTVRTYGDALVYLVDGPGPTLNAAVLDAQDALQNAASAGQIGQAVYGNLIGTAASLGQKIGALYSQFAAQGHGVVMSGSDAMKLSSLESDITSFASSTHSSIRGLSTKGWIGIGLGFAGALGLLLWATNKLPFYGRRKRRRR